MTVITKTIGRLPVNLGEYDNTRSYGRKNRVLQYTCELESKVDNNTYPPFTWDGAETFTLDEVHWTLISGNPMNYILQQAKPATTGTTGDYPYNGMGRVVLKKNIVGGVNTLTQDMFYKGEVGSRIPNTNVVFIVQYDFTLAENVTVPENCAIQFDGGSISGNYTLTYNNTTILGKYERKIDCICSGTVGNEIVNPLMYGAKINSNSDSANAIQKAIDNLKPVVFTKGRYVVDSPIVLNDNYHEIDFCLSTIKKTSDTAYAYTYDNVEYNDNAIIIYIGSKSPTFGYSQINNVILEGNGKNGNVDGIIMRYTRSTTLRNIRIDSCRYGLYAGGFLNNFTGIVCNDCYQGFTFISLMYSIIENSFNAIPDGLQLGVYVQNCTALTFIGCSSDNASNAAYYIKDSSVNLIGCSCEVKTLCIYGSNSNITIESGHYECYQYSTPNPVKYLQLSNSKCYGYGVHFHFSNYGSLETYESSNQISATNGSYVDLNGVLEYIGTFNVLHYSSDLVCVNGQKLKNGSVTLPIRNSGSTANRPELTATEDGFRYYDTTIKKFIYWNGSRWITPDGYPAIPTVGTTANRPVGIGAGGSLDNNLDKGFCYFDTDLGKPIYVTRVYDNGTVVWFDSSGNQVS